jgi:acetyl esterase
MLAVREHEVAGEGGPVALRSYHPHAEGEALPLVVYLHGGGWVTGGLDEADGPCRAIADAWGAVVVSVGYRLSPETARPGAVDDVVAALSWTGGHAEDVGAVGPAVVVGESAGGTLALEALLSAPGPPAWVGSLVLFYPPLRFRPRRERARLAEVTSTLSEGEMEWFWQLYAGGAPIRGPLDEPDLSTLPPTVVVTAGADILRDEGVELVGRLRDSGVPAAHLDVPGMVHGFLGMLGALPSARTSLRDTRHTLNLSTHVLTDGFESPSVMP